MKRECLGVIGYLFFDFMQVRDEGENLKMKFTLILWVEN